MDTKPAVRLIAILVLLVHLAATQNPVPCAYSQYVNPNTFYYVYSPNYPNSYGKGLTCSWIATCPANTNCKLNCELQLPQSQGCTMDRLLISRTGDPGLAGADTYCGPGSFTFVSTGNRISIGLLTSPYSTGGRFICELTAQPVTVNPPCSCGWRKANRIVGGVQTEVNEFPLMAALRDKRINSIKCGGSIISYKYVLTAGHCLLGHTITTLDVIAGEHNIRLADTQTQIRQVARLIIHPNMNTNNYDNDIGLVNTVEPFVYTDTVGPVCLPFKYESATFSGSSVTAMGWGTTFFGGPTSDYLQKVVLNVLPNSNCQGQTLTLRQMCTYAPGKDACQDDSGGPMIFTEAGTGLYFIAAIISHGSLCAQSPGINTRVTSHLNWITTMTAGDMLCRK